ncbi:hypothetical protein GCM10010300_55700 [Streptomyces olivaceoviridis]|nr:hypothetical protein GCM10010300_55700 [Streptomyces olivaceoviridis]
MVPGPRAACREPHAPVPCDGPGPEPHAASQSAPAPANGPGPEPPPAPREPPTRPPAERTARHLIAAPTPPNHPFLPNLE